MLSRRAASLLLAAACGSPAPESEQPGTAVPATVTDVRRYQLTARDARGLSDLAIDPDGKI